MKTVLITGGTRGIGEAAVKLFYEKGYHVAFGYKNSVQKATEMTESYPGTLAIGGDLSLPGTGRRLVLETISVFDGIDILINNAGIAPPQALFTDSTRDEWERVTAVNLYAAMETAHAAAGYMVSQKSGVIINISSMWGLVGASCEVLYSTVKAGLIGFTKALAKELGPSHIRVNAVAPGVIKTDMNAHLSAEDMASLSEETPLCRLGTAEDVAKTLLFLAEDSGSFYTGQVLSPNGGFVI